MGVVYEAEQLSLGRHVAIKVLPAHALLDARQLGRFQREARSAAKLHHTNIVPVFGVGEQDGLHYFVMQFIHGLGLDVVLDELRRLRQPRGTLTGRATPAARRPPLGCLRGCRGPRSARGELPRLSGGRQPPDSVSHQGADAPRSAGLVGDHPLPGQNEPSALSESGQQLLAERRPRRHAGGRCPGLCSRARRPAPRHQAVEPAAGRHGQRLGDRLRTGQSRQRQRRPDAHRRRRRHPALHGPGTLQRPGRRAQRRLQPRPDAVRVADAASGVRRDRPQQAGQAGDARRADPAAQAQRGRAARPGDGGPQGDRPRPGAPLPDAGRDGRRPQTLRRGPARPGAACQRGGEALALVPPQPAAGESAGGDRPGVPGRDSRGCSGSGASPRRKQRCASAGTRSAAEVAQRGPRTGRGADLRGRPAAGARYGTVPAGPVRRRAALAHARFGSGAGRSRRPTRFVPHTDRRMVHPALPLPAGHRTSGARQGRGPQRRWPTRGDRQRRHRPGVGCRHRPADRPAAEAHRPHSCRGAEPRSAPTVDRWRRPRCAACGKRRPADPSARH